jgi:hypothetical protein
MSVIEIHDAVAADAESGCGVMRQSITELCRDDHRNDQQVLNARLDNKQPVSSARCWRRSNNGRSIEATAAARCRAPRRPPAIVHARSADDWPKGQVKIIVPFQLGGSTDPVAHR